MARLRNLLLLMEIFILICDSGALLEENPEVMEAVSDGLVEDSFPDEFTSEKLLDDEEGEFEGPEGDLNLMSRNSMDMEEEAMDTGTPEETDGGGEPSEETTADKSSAAAGAAVPDAAETGEALDVAVDTPKLAKAKEAGEPTGVVQAHAKALHKTSKVSKKVRKVSKIANSSISTSVVSGTPLAPQPPAPPAAAPAAAVEEDTDSKPSDLTGGADEVKVAKSIAAEKEARPKVSGVHAKMKEMHSKTEGLEMEKMTSKSKEAETPEKAMEGVGGGGGVEGLEGGGAGLGGAGPGGAGPGVEVAGGAGEAEDDGEEIGGEEEVKGEGKELSPEPKDDKVDPIAKAIAKVEAKAKAKEEGGAITTEEIEASPPKTSLAKELPTTDAEESEELVDNASEESEVGGAHVKESKKITATAKKVSATAKKQQKAIASALKVSVQLSKQAKTPEEKAKAQRSIKAIEKIAKESQSVVQEAKETEQAAMETEKEEESFPPTSKMPEAAVEKEKENAKKVEVIAKQLKKISSAVLKEVKQELQQAQSPQAKKVIVKEAQVAKEVEDEANNEASEAVQSAEKVKAVPAVGKASAVPEASGKEAAAKLKGARPKVFQSEESADRAMQEGVLDTVAKCTQQRVYYRGNQADGCVGIFLRTFCSGNCRSYHTYTHRKRWLNHCNCCKAMKMRTINSTLRCPGADGKSGQFVWKKATYSIVDTCACKKVSC